MNFGMAVHNAPTDHGGIIPSTLMNKRTIMGKQVVRAGDGHFCPKCKVWSEVKASHDHVIFDGKSVAYENDELTCGARILKQQIHTVGNSRGIGFRNGFSSSDFLSSPNTIRYGKKFLIKDELTGEPLSNICYEIEKNGQMIHGKTDENGYTELIISTSPEEIQIHIIYEEHDHG